MNGAVPAGWVGESGSGLPVSKAFGWLVLGDCAEVACLAASCAARVDWVGGFGDAIPLGLCGGGVDVGGRGTWDGALDPERCPGLVYGYPRALLWAGIRLSQSDALGWYAAFYRTRVVWGGGGGPRAMLWAGIGRSYRTRVVWGGCVPRAMLWAGMRCPVGTRGEGRVVESLSGAGPAGWLRKAAAGFRIPRPSAGWFVG